VEELSGSSAPLKDAALGTDGSIVACTAKGAVFFARPGTGVAVVGGIRGAVAVGRLGADGRAVALLEDGSLRVWDPLAEVIRPVRLATPAGWVRAGARIKAISCGSAHILALGEDGNVYAWGDNSAGQLGVGDSVAREGATLTPVRGISARATAVGAGARHSVVVTAEGRALSFGSDDAMQLGLLPSHQWRPEGPGALEPTRVRLAEGVEVDGVACGDKFTILRGKDGRLISFGYGSFGQLGDGKLKHFGEIGAVRPMTAAAAVPGSPVVAEEVSCGADHCVMRTKEGEVWAWGANRQGQIGVGSRANASLPIPVTRAADKKIAIARAGGNFSLAIEQ
jgi:alpha-tubulin suppressor-like RCC1 family protein